MNKIKKTIQQNVILLFATILISLAFDESYAADSFCDQTCKDQMQNMLDGFQARVNIPAVSMTISRDDTNLNFYSGIPAKNSTVHVDENSFFEIGSITKSYTAALILKLEAEGKLSIEDKIDPWLPSEYSAWKNQNITIKQLLNMTSGIPDYYDDGLTRLYADPEHIWSYQEVIDLGYKHIPHTKFLPGEGWDYSNTGYALAGMIIEKATGKTLKENFEEKIFIPLKLKHTFYDPKLNVATLPNMVHGYNRYYLKYPTIYYDTDVTNQSIGSYGNAAGGIVSTTEDTTKWIRALFGRSPFSQPLLPAKQFQEMTSLVCADASACKPGEPLPTDTDKWGFSLGLSWKLGKVWIYEGADEGYLHAYIYEPKKNIVITTAIDAVSPEIQDSPWNDFISDIFRYFYPKEGRRCQVLTKDIKLFSNRIISSLNAPSIAISLAIR